MTQLSPHFKESEFACKCCGKARVDKKLVNLLEEIRVAIGKPIIIMSGYRCEAHNAKVGGAKKSQHVQGTAADIKVSGMEAADVQKWLVKNFDAKIGGLGSYKTFTHIDIRTTRARWKG
jgi:uncharacterized protein YcbK (DUF882 family)